MELKEEQKKYQRRIMPLSLFFMPCKDDKGNKWFDISLNGAGYPSIEETEEALKTLSLFLEHIKKIGQKELDKINKEVEEEQIKKMQNLCKSTPNKKKEKQKEEGYIYLLKSQELYKIGRAKYPENRIKTYRTENPFGIRVIWQKKVVDYIGKETELLERFKDKKHRGEWFKLGKEDIKWIKQNV